ncbi:hypothetical protein [Armatimonas rosea]|uniref:Uncharacterized protein n=1 Tax=Armatimonas rosea TaxID=685828 RepID=A0A7W9SX79_ARMRO|nr:hypothetical protein [Armatimonas rosea]MBB6053534.1 hypothetical protein [Armatimonas rosea]
MELQPADLGPNRSVEIFRMRAVAQFSQGNAPGGRLRSAFATKTGSNALTRFWAKESGLAPEVAEKAIQEVRGQLLGILVGMGGGLGCSFAMQSAILGSLANMPALAAAMGAASVGGFAAGGLVPRNYVRRWGTTPLSPQELDLLVTQEDDPLARSFLLLVREAQSQTNLPDAAQNELKEAIRVLGLALERLPSAPAETALRDTESLRAESGSLRQQALTETDRVAADSLERRADALERSASAMEKSATLLRRNSLLRQELQAQIEALRLELGSTVVTGTDTTSLAQVASVARGVAREADALATARAELDTPQQQRVGVG